MDNLQRLCQNTFIEFRNIKKIDNKPQKFIFKTKNHTQINNKVKIYETVIYGVVIYIFYNSQLIDDLQMRIYNQRLLDTLTVLCKTKMILVEILMKKYFEVLKVLEETIFLMDPRMRLNNNKSENLLMKDVVMHSNVLCKVKANLSSVKLFYYYGCNREYQNCRLKIENMRKLRKKLLEREKEIEKNFTFDVGKVKKVIKMKMNSEMTNYFLKTKANKDMKFQFANFSLSEGDYNSSLDSIHREFRESRIFSSLQNKNNSKSGLDFDYLASTLNKKPNNKSDKNEIANKITNKKIDSINNYHEIFTIDFTKSNSAMHPKSLTNSPSSHRINELNSLPTNPTLNTNDYNSVFSSLNLNLKTNYDNYSTNRNIEKNVNLDTDFDQSFINQLNNNIKSINNNSKIHSLYNSVDFQVTDFNLNNANDLPNESMILEDDRFSTRNLYNMKELNFSKNYEEVFEAQPEDVFDPLRINSKLRCAITEKGNIRYNKGELDMINFRGQISLELKNDFEIKNKIFLLKIKHDKWNDNTQISKDYNKEAVELVNKNPSNLKIQCKNAKKQFKILLYHINTKLVENLLDCKYKKEFSTIHNKLKFELCFLVSKSHLNKIKNCELKIEFLLVKNSNYQIYKSTSKVEEDKNNSKITFLINNFTNKEKFSAGIIFETINENLVSTLKLRQTYMVF